MGVLSAALKALFNPAKTTATHVVIAQNDGTPDGKISLANLAAAMGLTRVSLSSGDDLNDYKSEGTYRATTNDIAASISNTPITTQFVMDVKSSSNSILQVVYAMGGEKFWMRRYQVSNTTWYDWYEFRDWSEVDAFIAKKRMTKDTTSETINVDYGLLFLANLYSGGWALYGISNGRPQRIDGYSDSAMTVTKASSSSVTIERPAAGATWRYTVIKT